MFVVHPSGVADDIVNLKSRLVNLRKINFKMGIIEDPAVLLFGKQWMR